MNHGLGFQTFELEMQQAVANMRIDHRQKVIDRLLKMQASRDGEAHLGNEAAAEAFAAAFNRMMLQHELSQSDLDYAKNTDNDPIVQILVDLSRYRIEEKKSRIAWQETLASVVAHAHLCKFLIRPGSNCITFVGTKAHATVAEYVYGTLVPAAVVLCNKAYGEYGKESIAETGKWQVKTPGFKESWTTAFIQRLAERFEETKQTAVEEVSIGSSLALVRLGGALAKVQHYIDDKFKSRGASPLQRIRGFHTEGQRRGRAAADAMTIGRRGLESAQKMLR